jgi:SAM-dependent methyltransferase
MTQPAETGQAGAARLAGVGAYYSERLREHGMTARGVDWNSEASQAVRFDQLLKVCDAGTGFSLNDLGCGYAGLVDALAARGTAFEYRGWDISEAMVQAACVRFAGDPRVRVQTGSIPDSPADYTVASGIFNVRLDAPDDEWLAHILETLDVMDRVTTRGFAFNCLTKYSDRDRMRDYLYYADPCLLFDHCKRRYARNVSLLHDYDLYEFTILVRKATA